MTATTELRALLAEAKGVIEGLDAIISGEFSKEWADFFGKDYEDMSACLSRITAALAETDEGGWLPMTGKYHGEIWREHAALKGPDGRVWPAALETVDVLVQRPRYLSAQIAKLWLDTERNIQTSFPCGDAIRWQPLPPLPTERKV